MEPATIERHASPLSIVIALFAFDLTLLLKVWKVRAADGGNPTVVLDNPSETVDIKPISMTVNGNSTTEMMRARIVCLPPLVG